MKPKHLIKLFLDIIFPPICIACKKHLGSSEEKRNFLCRKCEKQIVIATNFFCPFCKRRLVNPNLCPTCKNRKDMGPRFIVAAAADYKNPVVQEIIRTLKYQKVKSALRPIEFIIKNYTRVLIENCLPAQAGKLSARGGSAFGGKIENFVIVSIPLHRAKERKRGFNQALLIAEILRKCLEIQPPKEVESPCVETGVLVKAKDAKSQTKAKNYGERKEFVKDSFKIKCPERVKGKNIILVDDIYTSGATIKEAVRVLKTAGAKKVIGFVVAKT